MVVDILSGLFTSQSCEQVWPAQKKGQFHRLETRSHMWRSSIHPPGSRVEGEVVLMKKKKMMLLTSRSVWATKVKDK